MSEISDSIKDVERFLHKLRFTPVRTISSLVVLAIGLFAAFYLKTLGEQTALVTFEVLKSGPIARLAPSRITPLTYRVSVINQSQHLADNEVRKLVSALQKQVHADFAPTWGIDAELTFVASGQNPNSRSWRLYILDERDRSYVGLGYHDFTSKGLPVGKVFAEDASKAGVRWTKVASHELLSMLVNPTLSLAVLRWDTGPSATLYAYEVTPPCQADEYGYEVDGALLSDFVTPAWFDPSDQPGKSRFDFAGHIVSPFQILPGGYASVIDLKAKSGWRQLIE
jgi:hypothetical protein